MPPPPVGLQQADSCFFSPSGRKFRSRTELAGYIAAEGITDINADEFDFSVRGKGNALATKTPAKRAVGRPGRSKESAPPGGATLAQKLVIKMSFPSSRSSRNGSDDESVDNASMKGKKNSVGGTAKKGKKKKGATPQHAIETELPLKTPRKRGRPPKPKPETKDSDSGADTPSKKGRYLDTPSKTEVEEMPVGKRQARSPSRQDRKREMTSESEEEEKPVRTPAKRGRKSKSATETPSESKVEESVSESVDPTDVQCGELSQDMGVESCKDGATEGVVVTQPTRRGRGRPKKVKATDPLPTESAGVGNVTIEEGKSDEQEMAPGAISDSPVVTPVKKSSAVSIETNQQDDLADVTEVAVTTPRRRGRKRSVSVSESEAVVSQEIESDAGLATVASPKRRGRKRSVLVSESEAVVSQEIDAGFATVASPKRRGRKRSVSVSESEAVVLHENKSDAGLATVASPKRRGRKRSVASERREAEVTPCDVDEPSVAQEEQNTTTSHAQDLPCDDGVVESDFSSTKPMVPRVGEPFPLEMGPRVRRKSWRLTDSLYDSGETRPRPTHKKAPRVRNKTTPAKPAPSDDRTIAAEASELYTMLKLPSGGTTTAAAAGGGTSSVQVDMLPDKLVMACDKTPPLVKASDLHELSNIEHIPKLPPSNILSDFSNNWEFLDNSDMPPAVASTSQLDLDPRDDVECYSTDLMLPSEQGEPIADISVEVKSPVQLDHSYHCVNPRMQKVSTKSKSPPICITLAGKLPRLSVTSPVAKRTKTPECKIGQSPQRGEVDETGGGDFVKALAVSTATTNDFYMSSSGDDSIHPPQSNTTTTAAAAEQQKTSDMAATSSLGRTSGDSGAYVVYV